MKILAVASEMVPYCKTGGLADVVGILPKYLAEADQELEITTLIPLYGPCRDIEGLSEPTPDYSVDMGHSTEHVQFRTVEVGHRQTVCFLQHPSFTDRNGIYGDGADGYGDNPWRFLLLCKAALHFADDLKPDVIHCHDWHTGLLPFLVRHWGRKERTMFTIHNIRYRGEVSSDILPTIGPYAHDGFTAEGFEFWGDVSYLKSGLVYADSITGVSHKFVEEILTPEGGHGMDTVLRYRQHDLHGILNGADYKTWNPETDPFLPANYSADTLPLKAKAKAALQKRFGLPLDPHVPLIGFVSRLTRQKGVDILAGSVHQVLRERRVQYAILGFGTPHYHWLLGELYGMCPHNVGLKIEFSEELAHLIQGGADMLAVPSEFEPCGLTQIYCQRYGTVPIVRATGGLDDTVADPMDAEERATGFKFQGFTAEALTLATFRALLAYGDRARWERLQKNGMAVRYSWDISARYYVELYRKLCW